MPIACGERGVDPGARSFLPRPARRVDFGHRRAFFSAPRARDAANCRVWGPLIEIFASDCAPRSSARCLKSDEPDTDKASNATPNRRAERTGRRQELEPAADWVKGQVSCFIGLPFKIQRGKGATNGTNHQYQHPVDDRAGQSEQTKDSLAIAVQRLSSGLRINSAMDDPAGLAISTRMGSQVSGMQVAVRNANDAISLSQVADGTLGTVGNMLQQMRDLAVQASNGTNGSSDLANLQTEFNSLATEINRELTQTTFNGKSILGSQAGTNSYQVGANAGESIQLVTNNMASNSSVTTVTLNTTSISAGGSTASAMITSIDSALTAINTERANYGADETEFQGVISNLQIGVTNQSAAESRVRDADYAQETAALTRAQILQQAGTAMLAQANALPQSVLNLLK